MPRRDVVMVAGESLVIAHAGFSIDRCANAKSACRYLDTRYVFRW